LLKYFEKLFRGISLRKLGRERVTERNATRKSFTHGKQIMPRGTAICVARGEERRMLKEGKSL